MAEYYDGEKLAPFSEGDRVFPNKPEVRPPTETVDYVAQSLYVLSALVDYEGDRLNLDGESLDDNSLAKWKRISHQLNSISDTAALTANNILQRITGQSIDRPSKAQTMSEEELIHRAHALRDNSDIDMFGAILPADFLNQGMVRPRLARPIYIDDDRMLQIGPVEATKLQFQRNSDTQVYVLNTLFALPRTALRSTIIREAGYDAHTPSSYKEHLSKNIIRLINNLNKTSPTPIVMREGKRVHMQYSVDPNVWFVDRRAKAAA